VEVAQDVDRPALAAVDVLERLERILDVAGPGAAGDHAEALGDRPDLEAHLALDAQLAHRFLDPRLLVRDDPHERVARADEVGDLGAAVGALAFFAHA